LNGATTPPHARPLLRNTVKKPSKLLWKLLLFNNLTSSVMLVTGSTEPNTLLQTLSHLVSINSRVTLQPFPRNLVQISRSLLTIWSGLLVKPGRVLSGATVTLHAKPLLRNTV